MSSRKPGYLIGVLLLALVMSAPQLIECFRIGAQAYQSGRLPLPSIPGFGGTQYYVNHPAFWRDKFVYVSLDQVRPNGILDWRVSAIDPETGETTDLGLDLSGLGFFESLVFGDRLWFVGSASFEVVDGALQPSTFNPGYSPQEGQQFLLNGEVAEVDGFIVLTLQAGKWGKAGNVVLPSKQRDWTFGQTLVNFQHSTGMTCLNQGDRIHVFLQVGGRLLHREGLELQRVIAPGELLNQRFTVGMGSTDESVSALKAANTEDEIAGWSLVRESSMGNSPHGPQHLLGMLVGGQPAALIVDDAQTGYPVGRLYRFDGTKWSEFATQPFPFGSQQFRAVSCRDGQKSYIVVTTSMGFAYFYAVEATGVRPTNGAAPQMNRALATLFGYGKVPVVTLVLGILLGLGTWCLMWWYTKPDYGFGVQTVKLASLGRRGLARLIDLALIVFSTAGLGWLMTLGFDWLSLVEALNLRVDHPTIPVAARVASILALWLAVLVLSLLVAQARWGLTPGKWLCGLRTLRTTLKPCGFARSLVREVVLSVDACHFLCWTPGIVCIALTDCRQRLGDLVADTIVVEAASLK